MSDVQEIVINPSTDVESVNFFYYRIKGSGELYRRIDITTPDRTYHLKGKAIQQLFRYLPVRYGDVKDIRDWRERNRVLLDALRSTDKSIVLSVTENNTVIRVTSSEFIAIPHSVVLQAVEEGLGNAGILFKRNVEYNGGMWATWDTNLTTNNYKFRIWVYNYNDGSHGLKIGTGAFILVCSNGLIRYRGHERMRIVHRSDIEKVRQKIAEFVDKAISTYLELDELIEKAKGIPINKKRAREILYRLNIPKWIRDVILGQREWRYSKVTLWDFSQMVTYVATHTPSITQRYRMELQKFGGRLLEDEKLIAEVRA